MTSAVRYVPPNLWNIKVKCKGKVVPVLLLTEHHAMKAYWGVEAQFHPFSDLGTRRRWVVSFTPQMKCQRHEVFPSESMEYTELKINWYLYSCSVGSVTEFAVLRWCVSLPHSMCLAATVHFYDYQTDTEYKLHVLLDMTYRLWGPSRLLSCGYGGLFPRE
jgi:hypothetical protein